MDRSVSLAILSDIHYAGADERARGNFCGGAIANPVRRAAGADYVVANGDYSCDSAFIGVSDDAACASARECLQKLRSQFGDRFTANFGDHEIGKKTLGADRGGLRLASYLRAQKELGLQPLWQVVLGHYVLLGVVSTLVAFPVYEPEALPEEKMPWEELRAQHLEEIRRAFAALRPEQRVLFFCHDPSALPFLWREETVRARLPQIEKTIIGHLHSPFVFHQSRLLTGMPVIKFLGHTPQRITAALREARHWKPFHVLLCPSLSGIELLKDGGYYTVRLDPAARRPAEFQRHDWKSSPVRR